MAIRRLQNKIANNRLSLLFTALYALAITLPTAITTGTIWVQLAIIAASTLLMVELNNAYALIREFSRMVSCSFLVLTIAHFQLIYSLEGSIVQICFIFFIKIVFLISNIYFQSIYKFIIRFITNYINDSFFQH
mgnify:CR=1 FL=1